MTSWEINLGLFPGLLFGFRQYDDVEENKTDYVLYIFVFDICYTVFYNEE